MNMESSRSHAIFTITVETSTLGPDGQHHVKMGRLHLVDLAVSLPSMSSLNDMAKVIPFLYVRGIKFINCVLGIREAE